MTPTPTPDEIRRDHPELADLRSRPPRYPSWSRGQRRTIECLVVAVLVVAVLCAVVSV